MWSNREKTHLILLVLPEQDIEGTSEAPYCENQQEEKPLHILNDGSESVHEGILGRLQHPAAQHTCNDSSKVCRC